MAVILRDGATRWAMPRARWNSIRGPRWCSGGRSDRRWMSWRFSLTESTAFLAAWGPRFCSVFGGALPRPALRSGLLRTRTKKRVKCNFHAKCPFLLLFRLSSLLNLRGQENPRLWEFLPRSASLCWCKFHDVPWCVVIAGNSCQTLWKWCNCSAARRSG